MYLANCSNCFKKHQLEKQQKKWESGIYCNNELFNLEQGINSLQILRRRTIGASLRAKDFRTWSGF